jgi:hypothetical protein
MTQPTMAVSSEAHNPADRGGQQGSDGGTDDGDQDALAPADPVDDRADPEGHECGPCRHPGIDPRGLGRAPAEVCGQHRQEVAEQDEVIDSEGPGEEANPGGQPDVFGSDIRLDEAEGWGSGHNGS